MSRNKHFDNHKNSNPSNHDDDIKIKNLEYSRRFIAEKLEKEKGKKDHKKRRQSSSSSSSSSHSKSKRHKRSRSRSLKRKKRYISSSSRSVSKSKKHSKKHSSSLEKSQRKRLHNKHNNNPNEQTNTLMISNLGLEVTTSVIEEAIREKCLSFETSMPEDVHLIESLRVAYIVFPSVQAAAKIYEGLSGTININGNYYSIVFTPNVKNNSNDNNKTSITYITNITDHNTYTTAMETTVHEDWICDYCDCKNFSKRLACFKCKRNKTINCRIIPVIKQKTTVIGNEGTTPPSTSLMVRGQIIKETNDAELLEVFSCYAQVKDIRMIRDKLTGEVKDFAFVEFFTIDEAQHVINQIKKIPVKIRDVPVFVTFSKIRRSEELRDVEKPNFDTVNNNIYNYNNGHENYFASNFYNPYSESFYQSTASVNDLSAQILPSIPDTKTDPKANIRREMTDREKVELEMKKWQKEQKKAEKKPENNNISSQQYLKMISLNFEAADAENEYDTVISMDNKNAKSVPVAKSLEKIVSEEQNQKKSEAICYLCKRKFPNTEKLKIHEELSDLHKQNLAKQQISQTNN